MLITENVELTQVFVTSKLESLHRDYRVFIGSNFPGDKKDEHLFRVISSIVDCVENGIICLLIELNDIYQTFYDLLNQKYTQISGK